MQPTPENQQLVAELNRKIAQLKRHLTNCEVNLNECKNWEQVFHEGELLKANLNQSAKNAHHIEVWDWLRDKNISIKIDHRHSVQEVMTKRFKKAKKLQRGIDPLTKHIQKIRNQIEELQKNVYLLQEGGEVEITIQKDHQEKKALFEKKKNLPYHEFLSQKGVRILVGKNSRANDQLTFHYARGNDWWLHVVGFSGSHVVIKSETSEKPDHDSIEDALQLALYYSKARSQGEAEVCLTQRKYVSRVRHTPPGKVQVKSQKNIYVRLDLSRIEKIKQS